jgi:hypothetical protein
VMQGLADGNAHVVWQPCTEYVYSLE